MKTSTLRSFAVLALGFVSAALAPAVTPDPVTGITLPRLGQVVPRHARDITSSPWSIGAETIDRDFTVYANFRQYLGPLGAKGVRLQAGWAKCEKVKGVYSWEWLDAIVDDAVAQGVRPWLEFNYGNPVYPGGGDIGLGGGFPASEEALAAWDRWCRALVGRYRDRVNQWEVWNEPDGNRKGTATVGAYVDLFVRTASMVRELQPESRIWALALTGGAGYDTYADAFLTGLKAKGKLGLCDGITIHGYPRNPDDTGNVDRLRAIVAKHGAAIEIRQGETGSPSRYQEYFALSKLSFSETTQAKWNIRRLLAHRAKDVPMNLFTLCDMHYVGANNQAGPDELLRMNYKGLVGTNPDQTVSHVKAAYLAAQTVFSIFDDSLVRLPSYPFSTTSLRGLALTGYRRTDDGAQVVAYWFNDAPPADANGVTLADFVLTSGTFKDPVLVDVRTGSVFALPADRWTLGREGAIFRGLPVYDSPILLVERAVLSIRATAP